MLSDAGSQDALRDAGLGSDASSDGYSGAGGSTGAGAGGVSGCIITLLPVAPPTFSNIEAGPGARLRVQGSVRGAAISPPVWIWTVQLETPNATIPTTTVDGTGAVIEFPIPTPGYYQIVAEISGQPTCRTSVIATAVVPQPAAFVFRTTATGFPVQDTRIVLVDATQQPTAKIRLDPGMAATINPERSDLNGGVLASYVRITNPLTDFVIDGDTTQGPLLTYLLSTVTYDLLVVPSALYAPLLISGPPLSWSQPLQIDPGVPVTAKTLDAAGNPVVGARMVLRRDVLPSTLGISDTTGSMQLRARTGTLAAYLVPPASSGLPRASVGTGGDRGIVFDPSVASMDLTMTWNAIAHAALSVSALAPDGSSPVAGARVRVTSPATAAPVGTLVARPAGGVGVSLPARGAIDVEVVTDAAGAATFAALPLGDYTLTIIPPNAAQMAALTTTGVTLGSGGLTRAVTLVTKATLTGILSPMADSAGAVVTAVDQSVTSSGAVVSGIVAGDGSYALLVDPGRRYELLVEPAPGVQRGRAAFPAILSSPGSTTANFSLPVAHRVQGTVTSNAGDPVGGALIQVFCLSASSKCQDPTFPLADAVSKGDGSFDLLLPEQPAN